MRARKYLCMKLKTNIKRSALDKLSVNGGNVKEATVES